MKKLLLGAAAAALAGAAAASAAVPQTNYHSALLESAPADRPVRPALTTWAATAPSGRKPVAQLPVSSRDQLDAKLGVATVLWANRKPSATTYSPLKAGPRAETGARAFLGQNAARLGLNRSAIEDARVAYRHDIGRGPVITRLQQTYQGLDVFGRQISVVMDRDMRPVAATGYFAAQPQTASGKLAGKLRKPDAPSFDLDAPQALSKAFADLGGRVSAGSLNAKGTRGSYAEFTAPASSASLRLAGTQRAKQVFYPSGKGLVPAWQLEIHGAADAAQEQKRKSFAYGYVVSAEDGKVLFRKNLTEYEAFAYTVWADAAGDNKPFESPLGDDFPTTPLTQLDPGFVPARTPAALNSVTLESGPISTGDPWLPAGATETVGNNVDAYVDLFGQPGEDPDTDTGTYDPALGDFRADVTSAGVFDYSFTPDTDPTTETARKNAVVNLFYLNNWMHDWWYDNGFNEAAGNAQTSNFGRGGVQGDPIQAQGQDWGGRNNANMTTPSDGGDPVMQMYLFGGPSESTLTVTTLGELEAGAADFGPTNFDVTAPVILANDGSGVATDACQAPLANAAAISGNIALVDRGSCNFTIKAANVQAAGAVGMLVADNVSAPISGLGGTDPAITIPAFRITLEAGQAVRAALPQTATMTRVTDADRDGTLDNHIVAHEFFHYVSNRLVGDAFGLDNQQGRSMGEGWSDVNALLLSVREGDDFGGAYATGAYTQELPYFGIRRAPYSVDPAVFPLTFRHIEDGAPLPTSAPLDPFLSTQVENSEVHNSGEIWANTLWTFYVALLNDPRYSFGEAQTRFKDYVIAGLMGTPSSPTFLEARDAILAAALATDEADYELAAESFARMGMGVGAIAPDRTSATHAGVRESFVAFAAAYDVTGLSLDFETGNIPGDVDHDGVLDAGETARITVTIASSGNLPLTDTVSATLTTDGDTSLPEGATVAFPAVDENGESTASFLLTLDSASTAQTLGLTLSFPQAGAGTDAVVEPEPIELSLAVHYDIDPRVYATDDVEKPLASEHDWTAAFISGGGDLWSIVDGTGLFDTGLGWYIPDNAGASDAGLTSPPIAVGTGNFSFGFDHFFQFELWDYLNDGTPVSFDGGVLEVSVDGGDWLDVLDAGGEFTEGGYTGWIVVFDEENWRYGFSDISDEAGAITRTTVDFGTTLAGSTVRFRFRAASDSFVGDFGWFLDNIEVAGAAVAPFSDVVPQNRPPAANAGADQQITNGYQVTLSGAASDPDGDALALQWTQTGGPRTVAISGAATLTASFTPEKAGTYTFRLTATDPRGLSASDTTQVVVQNPIDGGGSFGWLLALGGLLAAGLRRKRLHG